MGSGRGPAADVVADSSFIDTTPSTGATQHQAPDSTKAGQHFVGGWATIPLREYMHQPAVGSQALANPLAVERISLPAGADFRTSGTTTSGGSALQPMAPDTDTSGLAAASVPNPLAVGRDGPGMVTAGGNSAIQPLAPDTVPSNGSMAETNPLAVAGRSNGPGLKTDGTTTAPLGLDTSPSMGSQANNNPLSVDGRGGKAGFDMYAGSKATTAPLALD